MKFFGTIRNNSAVIQRIFQARMFSSKVNLDTWEPFRSSRVLRSSVWGGVRGVVRCSTTIKQTLSNMTSSPSQPYSLLVSGSGLGGEGVSVHAAHVHAHLEALGKRADFLTRPQSSCYKYVAVAFSAA